MKSNILFEVRHHATPSQEHDFAITVLAERHLLTPPVYHTKETWNEKCHELTRIAIIEKMAELRKQKPPEKNDAFIMEKTNGKQPDPYYQNEREKTHP
jgi:protein-tyrosine-phosphatase